MEDYVRSFEAEVMNSYNSGDAARAASHYADDALVFVPEQPPAKGRDAIAKNIARFMQDPRFRLDYVNDLIVIAASGDLAYTRGKLIVTYTDPLTKNARKTNSNYLLIVRKKPSARWEVVEDISF
jgi:uncharacterized protein (TIGR02246 family)